MTVGELQGRMSARELAGWVAFYKTEAEDRKKASLAAAANAGVKARRARIKTKGGA